LFVDLHVHLRGTIRPPTVRRMAARHNMMLPESLVSVPGYGWHDFTSFLKAYDQVTSVVQTARDLEEVAYEYLSAVAAEGTIYVEFMLSPPDLLRTGAPYGDQLAAIQAASDRAREESGIECRLIATAVRHLGPRAAVEAARLAVAGATGLVVGFGLTGDERQFRAQEFEEAFAVARSEGLKATAHAGEHLAADSIIQAIDCLRLDRIGHGVRAAESASVMRQLAVSRIPLEVCLSSNLALGLYSGIEEHPIASLAAAGCAIVLGTDDPTFFATSPRREYQLAGDALPLGPTGAKITEQAIETAFCDEATKARLRLRLDRRALPV
jgi:adenosine deaminase